MLTSGRLLNNYWGDRPDTNHKKRKNMTSQKTDFAAVIRADRFAVTKFETRQGKGGPMDGLQLGRNFVFKDIVETGWQTFRTAIEGADWTKPQTAKSLFNDPNWDRLSFGRRIAIGRCLRYFVDHEMLLLGLLNPESTGTKKYSLIER